MFIALSLRFCQIGNLADRQGTGQALAKPGIVMAGLDPAIHDFLDVSS
jgi:hypothetical protein